MDNLTITFKDLVALLTLIGLLWSVYKIIIEIAEPRKALEKRLDTLERWHKEDHERIKEMETKTDDIFRCVYELVKHEVTGNGYTDMDEIMKDFESKIHF